MKVTKTIDDCFYFIQNGANIKQSKIDGGYPITRIETISNDRFNRDKMGYAGITDLTNYSNYILENDDLLMSHINSPQYLGRTILYKKKKGETIIHGMNLLRLKANTELIKPSYARYVFYSNSFRQQIIKITKKSVNQASFSVNDLKKIKLELPEIKEQQNIVNKLDKISNIIDLKTKKLRLLDELVKARFVEMFGSIHENKIYPYLSVKNITTVYSGGTPNRKKIEYWENGTIPWVKTTELQNNHLSTIEECITKEGLKNSSAKIIPAKSILIAMYGQGKTRGMTAFLDIDSSTNQACACLLSTTNINMEYMWYYFQFSYNKLRGLAKGGNQPNLNLNMIKNFPVLVPPIALQNQFADFVKQVDKSKFMNVRMICKFKKNVR